ncbi:MAG TPA: DUF4296 domain-containing protein [Cyclobacteriaceae bacterium]|nr:DUF4296 domain-containing protein [Cyclobacteriaceae bacterium]
MKANALFAVLMISIGLFACRSERSPGEVLSEKEMVKVLIEIYMAEARVMEMHVDRDSAERVFQAYEQRIYQKLNIPEEDYKRSYQYYLENSSKLEKIYTAVVDSLSLREQRQTPATER